MGTMVQSRQVVVAVLALCLLISGCGKNNGYRFVGSYPPPSVYPMPPQQAPVPGYYPYPQTGYVPASMPPQPYPNLGGAMPSPVPFPMTSPVFLPIVPPPFPPAFTLFVPVFQIINIYYPGQWDLLWMQWQIYAQARFVSPFDFPIFWFEFAPRYWAAPPFVGLYPYMAARFYPWLSPYMNTFPIVNPALFWGGFGGLPIVSPCGGTVCR